MSFKMGKVRFGVVGTGKITANVIAGAREDERFEVTAVYSRTLERAKEFAQENDIPYVFDSLEEMASSDLVDVVYIASPNYMHCEQSILCMDCGKHVLCEKPLASNAAEVRRMVEAAKRNGVAFMEAMISTLNPNFVKMRENLSLVGPVRRYFAGYCQYSSRYDKFKEGVVLNAFKRELSNGAVMDIGIYTIYPMVALFGRPQSVSAQGFLLSTGVDAQGSVNFKYDGMDASVVYSKVADSYLQTEISGEKGSLVLDKIHIAESLDFVNRVERRSMGAPLENNPYFYEIKHFIDLIEVGKTQSEVNSWDVSLATIETIDEVRRQLGVHYPADEGVLN
jgi:predicted dehydrogenase